MATLFALLVLFISSRPVFAAEIININYKYKIAFTDLTENDVKAGDAVFVMMPDGSKAQMKVLETFPVMAKLTFPDASGALTDEQFNAITVGSAVHALTAAKAVKVPVPVQPEKQGSVETYSPPAPGEVPSPKIAPTPVTVQVDVPGPVSPGRDERAAVQDQRLDQMMLNNVKLAESVTKLLMEKNAAEAMAREKEVVAAAAVQKANELAAAKDALARRVQELEANVIALQQDKAVQQKEIEGLTNKLGELKKKLAKMVEIVNTNMKAYEKQ